MATEQLVLVLIMIGLTLYTVWAGADFGAGVWEFNTALGATERERSLIYRAVGPVWEANHVWLIFVVVGLHTGFPRAFAIASQALWVPLSLATVGIVFRGVGFAFRSYGSGAVRQQAAWGAVFALASTAAPFFLGAAIGAIASGRLAVTAAGGYRGNYLTGWISPLSIFTAFYAVGVCSYLAAVYLIREAANAGAADLVALWRRRALLVGVVVGVLSAVGLAYVAASSPGLWDGFRARAWPLVAASAAVGVVSLVAVWNSWHRTAVAGAATTVATVVWGWGVAQYPMIIPPTIHMESAKAPDAVLRAMVWSIAAGSLLLAPSLGFLFYLFKGKRPDEPELTD